MNIINLEKILAERSKRVIMATSGLNRYSSYLSSTQWRSGLSRYSGYPSSTPGNTQGKSVAELAAQARATGAHDQSQVEPVKTYADLSGKTGLNDYYTALGYDDVA
jgi:hypothetical protein